MRCGSTALWQALLQHPSIRGPFRKEVHYFDLHYDRGTNWYRSFFPARRESLISLDATPSYMAHPEAPMRARNVLPEAKVIAVLRDPVDRAWSHYRFRRGLGHESRSFAEALDAELAQPEPLEVRCFERVGEIGYIAGGNYAQQLAAWIESFGRSQILILNSEALFAGDDEASMGLQSFLGIEPIRLRIAQSNSAPRAELEREHATALASIYDAPNASLARMLGEDVGWG